MIRGGSVIRFSALCSFAGALLYAQHAGYSGNNSAGIGPSPIAPFHAPPSIGISGPSIGLSRPTIGSAAVGSVGAVPGNRFAGQYPSSAQTPNPARHSSDGPWRSGSREGRAAYGLPFGYIGAPYYLPFDNDVYPAAPTDSQAQPSADGSQLSEQVQQLSAKIDDLQNQLGQNQSGQNQLGQRAGTSLELTQRDASQPPAPPLTVVLKDGKMLQVQSYAIMGNSFWDFSSQPARKVPLANIDVPASIKASEASGAEFPPI